MTGQNQPTPDNEVRLHHVGDDRVDRLRVFTAGEEQRPRSSYAIVDAAGNVTLELIEFQHGAVCEAGVNGVTMEALLAIVADRLQAFQRGPMACRENALALTKIEEALHWLQTRTRRRLAVGAEGRGKP